jgi:hypothetical protein
MGLGTREIEIERGRLFTGCAIELDDIDQYRAKIDVQPGWTMLKVTFGSDRQAKEWPDMECDYIPDVGAPRKFTVPVGGTISRRFDLSRVRSSFTLYCSYEGDKIVFKPEIETA